MSGLNSLVVTCTSLLSLSLSLSLSHTQHPHSSKTTTKTTDTSFRKDLNVMVSSSSSSSSSSSTRTGSSRSSSRTGDENQELPDPWYEFKDEKSGELYYYNAETKETTWQRPTLTRSTSQDEEIAELKRQLQLEKDKVLKVIQESEKVVMQSLSEQSRQLHEIERLSSKLEQVNAERAM